MKIKFFIILILGIMGLVNFNSILYAQTRTPSPESVLEKQVDSLTDKIASRVAELKLVEKRGVIGKVTETSNTQITIEDLQGDTIFIDVDEFTEFTASNSSSEFGISDIKKGDELGILGLYNKESRRILARFVNELNLPQVLRGAVVSINEDDFVLRIKSVENKEYLTDVETSTRTVAFDKEEKILVRSGFSEIEENQTVIVVGYPDLDDENIFQASRIIVLPNVSVNPNIDLTNIKSSPTPSDQ